MQPGSTRIWVTAFLIALIGAGCAAPPPKKEIILETPTAWPSLILQTKDPITSMKVPSNWRTEEVAHTTGGSGKLTFTRLLRAVSPQVGSQKYLSTVLVNVISNTIKTPISQASLDRFIVGAKRAAPEMSILKSEVVDLPCGEAILLEDNRSLKVGNAMVLYHQYLYTIPHGTEAFNVIVSAPAEDMTVAELQKEVVATFKIYD